MFWLKFIPGQAPGGHQQPTLGFFTAFQLLPADVQRREDGKYIPTYRLKWTCFALHNLKIQKTNFLV